MPAPSGYDPPPTRSGQFEHLRALYDALFVTDETGEVQPSLVSDFSNNPENTQTTLTLIEGVLCRRVDADSTLVKTNLDRRSNPDLEAFGLLAPGGGAARSPTLGRFRTS